MNWTDTDW